MPIARVASVARRNQFEWLLLAVALVLLAGILVFVQLEAARITMASEKDRLRVQADVIADDLERNLIATSVSIAGIQRDFLSAGSPDADATRTPQVISRRLRALVEASPGVRGMGVCAEDGRMIASNRADVVGQDFSSRDYFAAVRKQPDPSRLYLSAPFKTSGSPDLITGVSRMVLAPGGGFGGIIVATLDPVYFSSVLRPAAYAPDVWAMLVHGDGVQLTNFPLVKNTDGTNLNRPGTFFRRHMDSGQRVNVLTGAIYTTGEQRMMALRTVQPAQLHMDKPLVVGVSRSLEAINAPLLRQSQIYGVFYVALSLMCGAGLYASQNRRTRFEAIAAERDQAQLDAAERVQLALHGGSLGLWEIDVGSGGWSCDETACAMVGYSAEDMGGTPGKWRSLMHPEDLEVSAQLFKACVEGTAQSYDFTYRMLHLEGHWVWILARGKATGRDAQGRALRIMGTVMDISAAKKAEVQVVQARNELQAVFHNMTEGLLVFNHQHQLVHGNPAGTSIHGLFDLGQPRHESRLILEVRGPDGEILPVDQWPLERALRGDFVRDHQMQLRRIDTGAMLFVESNTAPIPGYDGHPDLVLHTFRDVTERRASMALRESEARFRTLIEDAPLAIAIFRSGHLVYSNPRYRSLHGYSNEQDLIGLPWSALILPASRLALDAQQTLIAADSATEQSFEATGLGRSGAHVQVLNITSRVKLADGAATLIFAQDITAQKQAEAALVQARDAAESANRSKADFLSNMSHEIRSPMNVILGLVYLLEKVPLGRDAHDMVHKIRIAGRRLLGIINDILDVSKIEAGRMDLEHAAFRLGDVIDNVASTMGVAAGDKNIELVVEQEPADGVGTSFMGDSLRLEQVLINLTSNAIKFTSAGQVVLRVERLSQQGDSASMRFSVRDTGIGIAPELQKEVFTAFSQADSSTTRRFGGTGLGLTICRQLVTLMGGEIGLDSVPGQGSTFWFTLELQLIPNSDFSSPEMTRINTLVADDSSIARDAVVATARGLGWEVEAFDSGEAALAAILGHRRNRLPDVAVLDWKMPGMDGLATARAIRDALPPADCPIVIMATAYSLSALTSQPDASLVDAVLSKPVTISALYNSVLEARRRRAANADLAEVPAESSSAELQGVRLLVVDDSEINCEIAKRILEDHGATVSLAFDGGAAMDWLLAHPWDVDLVLLDVQMPVMDGLAVTRRLRQLPEFKTLPIVALTAGAFKSHQEAAREAGMTDFVGKPFDVPTTIALIQRLTRKHRPELPLPSRLAPAPAFQESVPAPEAPTPERLVMDVNRGLRTWGRLDTYHDYLRRFASAYACAAVTIATSLSMGDRAGASALAHKLAGVAANMALPESYRLAADVERLLAEERDATATLAQLDTALQEACALIERFAPEPGSAASPAPQPALDPRSVPEVQTLLDQLLAALDTDSPVPVEPVMARLVQLLPASMLLDIKTHLRNFDFRATERAVRELIPAVGTATET